MRRATLILVVSLWALQSSAANAAPAKKPAPAATPAPTPAPAPAAAPATPAPPPPAPAPTPPPVVEVAQPAPPPPSPPAAKWDALAGGIKQGEHLAMGSLTHTLDISLTYLHGVADNAAIGFSIANDTPGSTTGTPLSIYAALAVRLGLMQGENTSFGLRLDPNVHILPLGNSAAVNVGLNLGAGFGYWIMPRLFMMGGGLDVPFVLTVTPNVTVIIPILVGPFAEVHLGDHVALFIDVKGGVNITLAQVSPHIVGRIGFAAHF